MSLGASCGIEFLTPIVIVSLFVQLEIARFVQAWFIMSDLKIFHEEKNYAARARTSNLNEDLGQVPLPPIFERTCGLHAPCLPPPADKPHFLGQNWDSHAKQDGLSVMLYRRQFLRRRPGFISFSLPFPFYDSRSDQIRVPFFVTTGRI